MVTSKKVVVSVEEFEEIFESIKNWGRWGADDERGALNLITPDKIRQSGATIKAGRTISCAAPMPTTPDVDNPTPVMNLMLRAADMTPSDAPFGGNVDYLMTPVHGPANTHIDAFCHIIYKGKLYNGVDASTVKSTGAEALSISATAANGIVSRAILLDIPRLKGLDWLEPGSFVMNADLEAAEAAAGVRVESGDILLIRNGARTYRGVHGGTTMAERTVPGLHPETLRWLHERDIAVLGGDADSDTWPSPVPGLHPIHLGTLVAMGVLQLDNLALDELAVVCAELGRWEFQLSIAPLRLERGTGSPVNPIAVL